MAEASNTMKKLILSLLMALGLVSGAAAAEGGIPLDRFPVEKLTDLPSLQHGAKLFVNYCLNCHSAALTAPPKRPLITPRIAATAMIPHSTLMRSPVVARSIE